MKYLLPTMSFIFFIAFFDVNGSSAIVTTGAVAVSKDETVTGTYKGYKDGSVIFLRSDGSSSMYSFNSTQKILKKIAGTKINTTVTIKVENGYITEFEAH